MLQDYQLHLYRTLIHKKKDEDFEIIRKSSLNFCHMEDDDYNAFRRVRKVELHTQRWVRVVADAVILSAREQGPLSTLDAMEFPDRRGTAMANEP